MPKEKFIYKVTRSLTKEQFREIIEDSIRNPNLDTTRYLAGINNAPDFHSIPPHCFIKYKG